MHSISGTQARRTVMFPASALYISKPPVLDILLAVQEGALWFSSLSRGIHPGAIFLFRIIPNSITCRYGSVSPSRGPVVDSLLVDPVRPPYMYIHTPKEAARRTHDKILRKKKVGFTCPRSKATNKQQTACSRRRHVYITIISNRLTPEW